MTPANIRHLSGLVVAVALVAVWSPVADAQGKGGRKNVGTLTITCPAPITVEAQSEFGAWVSLPTAQTSGGQNPVRQTSDPESGIFRVGTTEVTVTATSKDRQAATCTYAVTVTLIAPDPEPTDPAPDPEPAPDPIACSTDQEAVPSDSPLVVAWQSTDASVTGFSVRVDTGTPVWVPAGTFEASIPGVPSGVHAISVQALNGDGSGETVCMFDVVAVP